MAKHLTEILQGVKSSTIEPMDISDFEQSKGGQDFAKQHPIEKHADRVGNVNPASKIKQAKMKRHGLTDTVQKKVSEESVYEEFAKGDTVRIKGITSLRTSDIKQPIVGKTVKVSGANCSDSNKHCWVEVKPGHHVSIGKHELEKVSEETVEEEKYNQTYKRKGVTYGEPENDENGEIRLSGSDLRKRSYDRLKRKRESTVTKEETEKKPDPLLAPKEKLTHEQLMARRKARGAADKEISKEK